ncbi:hypothetical protein ACEN9H_23490 [Massilia cellulosiltytica]|uniref:hypothetical protein n=1 Tax=Massilia cellulosiltytica TaxID=2683234 RepID=UPI0039B49854
MSDTAQMVSDIDVQCTRCRNKHKESDRQHKTGSNGWGQLVCPRCQCTTYFDIRPQVAWCWASGLIETGDVDAMPEGAILVASGPKAHLHGTISALARIGRGASEGKFLVPGVPELDDQKAKNDALAKWLTWCARNNGHKGRHGVVFVTPNY